MNINAFPLCTQHSFILADLDFTDSEHFFQFSKFIDTDAVWARKIMHEYLDVLCPIGLQ